ncbi:MAG: hypothetical protein J5748_05225 [Bacteroidales bacterium]|nr:hypothetical protein [Bacteroidales bacterium]
MKFRWTLILAAAILALSSCLGDLVPFDNSGPSKKAEREGMPGLHFDKMMILYSEGYNNLQGSLDKNINELCEGYIPPKWGNDAIVVFSHASVNSSDWATDTEPVVFRIYEQYGEVVRDTVFRYPAESVSVEKEFMKKVLGDIKDRYPSDSYGMVYTSHGTGWIPKDYKKTSETFSAKPMGIGAEFDGTYPSYTYIQLDIDEFREAIPFHMDYIVMDACLMGGVEVVYEWRDICDYLAASPGEVLTVGFDYYKLSERLLKGDEPDLVGICTDYYEMNAIDRNQDGRQDGDATIALYDCSKIEALAQACVPIFEAHRSALATIKTSQVQSFNYTYKYHFDFRDILVKLGATPSELVPVDAALDELVLYKNATEDFLGNHISTYSGLSMFLPVSSWPKLNDCYKSTSWNQATGFVK